MKTRLLFLIAGSLFMQQMQAQIAIKLGLGSNKFSEVQYSHTLGSNSGQSMYMDAPTGGAFYLPLQVGYTSPEARSYDVGLGLDIGTMKVKSGDKDFRTGLMRPNFYVQYYIINNWAPLQFGLGAAVSYSKIKCEWTESYSNDADEMVEYSAKTSWGGLGYGVSLLGRYWFGDDEENAIEFGIGSRADWRKLKSLNVNGADESFDKGDISNLYETSGMFFQLSFVRAIGG